MWNYLGVSAFIGRDHVLKCEITILPPNIFKSIWGEKRDMNLRKWI